MDLLDNPFGDHDSDLVVELEKDMWVSLEDLQKNLSKTELEEIDVKKVFDKQAKISINDCSLKNVLEKLR